MPKIRFRSGDKNGNTIMIVKVTIKIKILIFNFQFQIDKGLMQRDGMVNRVRQEVAIHSKLKHPAILELYTFFEDANNVYLVLELAHNGELHRYMKDHQRVMTEIETATILSQVVNGLLYLKLQNILHRDMSLSNLLLTKDLQVKIADFGLATQLTRPDEKHMTLCGTPNYISPEVASRASHGLPVDVWGLGCMMYTLLVGKPPFDTDGVKSTLTKVVMTEFMMPTFLSTEAKNLLSRLLCKNPKERIHIDDVLAHPFMTKYSNGTMKYNATMASVDSGLVTMSSGTVSSHNNTERFGLSHSRSRSEERHQYQHLPFNSDQQTTNSHYSFLDQNRMIAPVRNGIEGDSVKRRFESMELTPNNSVFGGKFGKPCGNNVLGNNVLGNNVLENYGSDNLMNVCNTPMDSGGGFMRHQEPVNAFDYGNQENHNHLVSLQFAKYTLCFKQIKSFVYISNFTE